MHPLDPPLPWYEIPGRYHRHREHFLGRNGAYRFSDYGEIARRWLLKPVFTPVHPSGDPPPVS